MICKIERFIFSFRSGYVNEKLILYTNLVFHILSIIFITKNIELTKILYFFDDDKIKILKCIQYTSLFTLFISIFINKNILYILNFIFISILLNTKYGYNVEDLMFQLTSFWLVFINISKIKIIREITFWNNQVERSGYIFLFGFNIMITVFVSGIGKMLDPVWTGNYGMYYVMSLPWISITSIADIFRDNELLVIILSKLALIFELIVLPMYLIKRFRIVSIILLLIFWFTLMFPMRLDFIGPIGIISCFYLTAQIKLSKST